MRAVWAEGGGGRGGVWARIEGPCGWGCRWRRGFGHALEACKNFLSTAVGGGSTGAVRGGGGEGGGGGGGLGTHWRPVQ